MVLFNYSTRELTAKIVYYGPGLCGKTTNLQYVYEQLPEDVKGKMLSLATKTDRTLFFDFLPMDLGEIRGMKTRVQLYTVPGQVFYNETRKLVLKGADGVVFVADSQEPMMSSNVESLRNLEENLKAHGMRLSEIPHVFQFNKRDLPRLSSIDDLNAALNKYNAPCFEAVATTGIGVQDTLKGIAKLVLLNLTRRYQPKPSTSAHEKPAPQAANVPEIAPTSTAVPAARAAAPARPAAPPQAARNKVVSAAVPARQESLSVPRVAVTPPPAPVLVGSGSGPGLREAGMASFGEIEIDEMVGGLREAEGTITLESDEEVWESPLGADAAANESFGKVVEEEGYFLGEPEAASDDPGLSSLARGTNDIHGSSPDTTPLAVGESREVVVPVEIREGKVLKRFKLRVSLRLDRGD